MRKEDHVGFVSYHGLGPPDIRLEDCLVEEAWNADVLDVPGSKDC